MYGCGKNEELLAKVLKEDRKKIFLCTKFGNVRGPNGEFAGVSGTPEYPLFFLFDSFISFSVLFPFPFLFFLFLYLILVIYVKEACNKSLKRLGVDYIDLYPGYLSLPPYPTSSPTFSSPIPFASLSLPTSCIII